MQTSPIRIYESDDEHIQSANNAAAFFTKHIPTLSGIRNSVCTKLYAPASNYAKRLKTAAICVSSWRGFFSNSLRRMLQCFAASASVYVDFAPSPPLTIFEQTFLLLIRTSITA